MARSAVLGGIIGIIVLTIVLVAALRQDRQSASANALSDVAAVKPQQRGGCVLTEGGEVKCWGYGDLCIEPCASLLTGISALDGGPFHSCAVTAVGTAKCWGANFAGQLGDGTTEGTGTPVDVCADRECADVLASVIAVAAGYDHTCGLTAKGRVKCWGGNGAGQLGDGTTMRRTTPVEVCGDPDCVTFLSGVTAISAGYLYTCAITGAGTVVCWGDSLNNQLGTTTTETCRLGIACSRTPLEVSRLGADVIRIAAGGDHTCALTTAGGVKCWGENRFGQLGDGTNVDRTAPADVLRLAEGAADITAGGQHTCARTTLDNVLCWGYNWHGQVSPRVEETVDSVTAGESQTCAATGLGRAKCWGYGHVGVEEILTVRKTPTGSPTPTPTPTATSVRPPVIAEIEMTVNGRQGPITVTAGDAVVYRWIVILGLQDPDRMGIAHVTIDDNTYDVLDDECDLPGECEKAAVVNLLTPGPVTNVVSASTIGIPPRQSDDRDSDSVTVFVVTPTPIPTATPTPTATPVRLGDADCDGSITSTDAGLILQLSAALKPLLPCATAGDVNSDGYTNAIDAALILQYVAGLLPSLPP